MQYLRIETTRHKIVRQLNQGIGIFAVVGSVVGVTLLSIQPFGDNRSLVNLGATLALEAVAIHTILEINSDPDE